jgi:hypothetical protein
LAGDCVASVFPINRREGKIGEVLLLDAKPEARICTLQIRPVPSNCIRLSGWTLKLWSAAALSGAQKGPLCTIYDVVKHLQLEDGRLFLWRIREGTIIRVRSSGLAGNVGAAGAAAAQQEEEECRRWTENPNLIACIFDPITLELVDVPLDSTFGQGKCPFEFIDGGIRGVLVSAGADPLENRIKIRLLDLKTGQCFRKSSIELPEVGPNVLPLHPEAAAMLLSRNNEVGGQILAGAALYDCRVFRWRLKDEWMAPETRYKPDKPTQQHQSSASLAPPSPAAAAGQPPAVEGGEPAVNIPINTGFGTQHDVSYTPYGFNNSIKPNSVADQYQLHHIFTTVNNEPICDLSMSTCAKRIYVVGLENLYILADDGTLQYTLPMNQWRGVREARSRFGHVDVGAFSWPIPNSKSAAFYLDITNSVYITNFEDEVESGPIGYAPDTTRDTANGQYTYRDRIQSLLEYRQNEDDDDDDLFNPSVTLLHRSMMHVESHTDVLPKPKAPPVSATGRINICPDTEPVIVEYIQSGKTIFTSGHSTCSGTAALLKEEMEAGTYLHGLGPKSVAGRGKKAGPFVSRPGGATPAAAAAGGKRKKTKAGDVGTLAPRAIICIDTETGRRYKTIPIEGMIESVHAAGHLLVAAVAPLNKGAEGSLVVIDFSMEGFGLTDAHRAEQRQALQSNSSENKKKNGGAVAAAAAAVVWKDGQTAAAVTGPSKPKRSRHSKK